MKNPHKYSLIILLVMCCCQTNSNQDQFQRELQAIDLLTGDIALCGSGEAGFGKVEFGLSCQEKVRANFNMATALLHSFEYTEAEKVFAKVIAEDPECLMAYWGVAMSNFHPLWARPSEAELNKGSKAIALARSLESRSPKETDYLEAVATLFDDWNSLDHNARLLKFEKAAEEIHKKYPTDTEAAIFYALALRAASDPADKSFSKQHKAGAILNGLFPGQPDHPGIAHYLIHTYDYPELAHLALPAARKYASIAGSSAHALHMPSHIFTRLGLWDESIQSNINSMSAAKCYAENSGIAGHWDEELHGLDYLVYAYLQQGQNELAKAQMDYLRSMDVVFPLSNKNAYTFAAVPTRIALETKDWEAASKIELKPDSFPWQNFPWERSLVSFGRALGFVHMQKPEAAKEELTKLQANHAQLVREKKTYEATQVAVQIKAAEAWIRFAEGNIPDAISLMNEAAAIEDATEKHPVTPGEVVPARELLGDLFMELGDFQRALQAYEANLERHPGRFNALYGAALAADKAGDKQKAITYLQTLIATSRPSEAPRPEIRFAESYLKRKV